MCQPPALLTAVSRLSRNRSRSSIYILGTDRTENTASNISSIVVCACCGHYLATAGLYRPITLQRPLYSCLFRGRCPATGLPATIYNSQISLLPKINTFSSFQLMCRPIPRHNVGDDKDWTQIKIRHEPLLNSCAQNAIRRGNPQL
jgi:hypothetical protein